MESSITDWPFDNFTINYVDISESNLLSWPFDEFTISYLDISESNKNEIIKSSNIFTNDLKKSHEEKFINNNQSQEISNEMKI